MVSFVIRTRGHPKHVVLTYDEIEHDSLLETWANVEVRSVIRIFCCEVCQTDGNSSPVGGGVWSVRNVRQSGVNVVQCLR